ncbi:hypothetical protein GCM10010522_52530 [Kribbella solani]
MLGSPNRFGEGGCVVRGVLYSGNGLLGAPNRFGAAAWRKRWGWRNRWGGVADAVMVVEVEG